jgi:hypothetical protein
VLVEHNHGKLWQGYAIAIFVLGVSVFLGTNILLVENMTSTLFILGVMIMLIGTSILMFKGVNDQKRNCPNCQSL